MRWTARRVRPVVALCVAGIFIAFVAVAHSVLHSGDAVKALLVAAVSALVALIPGILTRIEYRLAESGLYKRLRKKKEPAEFKQGFAWAEVTHLAPTKSGFKGYKHIEASSPMAPFFKLHVSGEHSCELHVGPVEIDRVREVIEQRGIPIKGRSASRRLP